MHPNSRSPALPCLQHTHVYDRPNAQLYTGGRSLSTKQIIFININRSQTAYFRCFAPPVTQGSESRNGTLFNCYQIKKTTLDKNSLLYTLAFASESFATDVNCLELHHLHLRKLGNFMLQWIYCKLCIMYSLGYLFCLLHFSHYGL